MHFFPPSAVLCFPFVPLSAFLSPRPTAMKFLVVEERTKLASTNALNITYSNLQKQIFLALWCGWGRKRDFFVGKKLSEENVCRSAKLQDGHPKVPAESASTPSSAMGISSSA